MKKEWIDISAGLRDGMAHWPGDPEVRVERISELARGAECEVSRLSMSAHTGTHMDAPAHFLAGAPGIDAMPLEATVGPARVIAIRDGESIKAEELRGQRIRAGERLLFKTRNSLGAWWAERFREEFVFISPGAARYLAERRVRAVGIDYLSVGGFGREGVETHQALLGAGIWIIEGLDLSRVEPGRYELVCLPLKVVGADGAPARAVVR